MYMCISCRTCASSMPVFSILNLDVPCHSPFPFAKLFMVMVIVLGNDVHAARLRPLFPCSRCAVSVWFLVCVHRTCIIFVGNASSIPSYGGHQCVFCAMEAPKQRNRLEENHAGENSSCFETPRIHKVITN